MIWILYTCFSYCFMYILHHSMITIWCSKTMKLELDIAKQYLTVVGPWPYATPLQRWLICWLAVGPLAATPLSYLIVAAESHRCTVLTAYVLFILKVYEFIVEQKRF
jgi:hypothetical protein